MSCGPGRLVRPMKTRLIVLGIALALTPLTLRAQTTSTFTPPPASPPFSPSGTWNNPNHWDTTNFPNNGQPTSTDTYNAIVRTGTVFVNGAFTIEDLTLGADGSGGVGAISPSGSGRSLTINGLFTWEAGSISSDITIEALGGVSFTTSASKSLNTAQGSSSFFAPIINSSGPGLWTGGTIGGQQIVPRTSGGQFNNLAAATFTATAGGQSFKPAFNNFGNFISNPGAGQTIKFDFFQNDGTVTVQSGDLFLDGFPNQINRISGGDFEVESGATLRLGSYDLLATSSVSGAGNVRLLMASNQGNFIRGTYAITGETSLEGSVNLIQDISTGTLVVGTNALKISSGEINVSGQTTWLGNLSGTGGDGVVNAAGGLDFAQVGTIRIIDDLTVNLGGTSTWSGAGGISLEDRARINVLAGATWNIGGARTLSGEPDSQLVISGTLSKSGGGALNVSAPTTSTGLVVVGSGSDIAFTGGFTQTAGELRLEGGATDGLIDLQGGLLTGFGEMRFLDSAARIELGLASTGGIGELEITQRLDLLDGGIVVFDLAGTAATQFDRIFSEDTFPSEGDFTLGGDLAVAFLNGFQSSVSASDTFEIILAPLLIDGQFMNVAPGERLTTSDGFGSFIVNYGATSLFGSNKVVLSDFQAIPEPATVLLLALGALAFAARRWRKS